MKTIAIDLHNLLANNIVRFTFRKLDGTIRHAVGTRNLTLVTTQCGVTDIDALTPKGKRENPNAYFDIERLGWRAYSPANIISIDEVVSGKVITNIGATTEEVEIPISKDGNDRDFGNFFDTLPTGFEFVGGSRKGELPTRNAKVGNPIATERGIELPLGKDISVDDFARLVAKYVVEELGNKLK